MRTIIILSHTGNTNGHLAAGLCAEILSSSGIRLLCVAPPW